jgi:hypothetical protein
MPKTFDTQCVGIQYRVTPSTRRMIQAHIEKHGPLPVMLVREHDNEHDENAIKVVIRATPYKGLHIGYLPRGVAAVYGPALDTMKLRVRESHMTRIHVEEGTADVSVVIGKHPTAKKSGSTKRISRNRAKGA